MGRWKSLIVIRKIRFEDFIISPFFISLLIASAIIFFMPRFQKYKVEIIENYQVDKTGGLSFYSDLDQDAYCEKIVSFEDILGRSAIKVTTYDDKIVDQWAFDGKLPPRNHNLSVYAGDFNHDGLEEIFSLYRSGDSIFLDIMTPMDPNAFQKRRIFIDRIGHHAEKTDYSVRFERLMDMNGDDSKDLIFNIYAGFSLQPRRLYVYNIAHDTLLRSPTAGVVLANIKIIDLDHDGFFEIIGNTSGPGNIKASDSIPYRDSSSYLIVLNHELKFEFNPIEFPVYKSAVVTQPISQGDSIYLLVLSKNSGIQPMQNTLRLYNAKGALIRKKVLDKSEVLNPDLIEFEPKDLYDKVLLIDVENSATFEVDASLNIQRIDENLATTKYYMEDVNGDGRYEYIGFSYRNSNLLIYQNTFQHPVSIRLESDGLYHAAISFVKAGDENEKVYVQRGNNCYLLAYLENPWYKYLFFVHIGIWLLVYLFMLFVKKLYRNQVLKQQALAKEISALQLNSINNQINPHFIFNAMNSITSAIYKEEKEKAYRFGTKFSNLMREALLSSDHISRTLDKELEFVKNYLDLEKLRFKNKFDYRIEKEDGLNMHAEVPKMIIQTFVENSVKHGLGPINEHGLIVVRIQKQENMLRIEIEDNGIGRKKARELSRSSTGKGLGILSQIFDLYKRLKGVDIHYSIIDLKDNSDKATGTLVILQLPYVY